MIAFEGVELSSRVGSAPPVSLRSNGHDQTSGEIARDRVGFGGLSEGRIWGRGGFSGFRIRWGFRVAPSKLQWGLFGSLGCKLS